MSDVDQEALRAALKEFYFSQNDIDYTSAKKGLTVVQYWNDEPDEQVALIIENTRREAESYNFRHLLFDEPAARSFLSDRFGLRSVSAFDRSFHQAQKSDIFRYHYLLSEGGIWVDADITIRGDLTEICKTGTAAISYKNKTTGRLSNRIMWSSSGTKFMKLVVDEVLCNMEDVSLLRRCATQRDILSLSGPKIINFVFLKMINSNDQYADSENKIFLIDEENFNQIFISGQSFLGEELSYKDTDRSWQKWASEVEGTPISQYLKKNKRT